MRIQFSGISKTFGGTLLFKDLANEVEIGKPLVILGKNGSGKSTLLQILMGAVTPSTGEVRYFNEDLATIPEEYTYGMLALVSPWMEWIEEFTQSEMIAFYKKFRALEGEQDLLKRFGLDSASNKYISKFSSGMKQRLKLALAFSDTAPCLFLDEPCANLDTDGMAIYQDLLTKLYPQKLVIIASNDFEEYQFLPYTELKISPNH